ncbi:MAG: formyltetrahydrofolate deformylase [Gammaproteobacteria bacterium]|nr:formyltetrahydrofolate deformylase [Gammaproteobacteria bacterium]
MQGKYHLIISCPDTTGVVAAVSGFIAKHNGLIIEADHHTDADSRWFFMRYEIDANTLQLSVDEFNKAFAKTAQKFKMNYQLVDACQPKRVLILVSKASHCLEDILYRWQSKELNCQIVGVVSNHEDLRERSEWYQLPYHYLPIGKNKTAHFDAVSELINKTQADIIVLARYMQILPKDICEQQLGKIINIHHSFLPSFAGGKPYQQAYQRGVKLIGATSHYATAELDEGPIIEQDTLRISHRQNLTDYIRLGKDIERTVLAKALKAQLEDRIILHNNKTVVFG